MTKQKLAAIFALAGALLFIVLCFPFPIRRAHSCLLDWWLSGSQVVAPANPWDLVRRYVMPYGLIWWAALAVAYVGVILLSNIRRKSQNSGSK